MQKNIKTRTSQASIPRSAGFTLTEVLVVIVIIAVLAAVLVPTVTSMKDRASAAGCASNMRQCTAMAIMFTTEQGGRLPRLHVYNGQMNQIGKTALPVEERIVNNGPANFWPDQLTTYAEGASMFCCPKLTKSAVKGPGGGVSKRIPLGIGINYYRLADNTGKDDGIGYNWPMLMNVPEPSRIVWFADAAGDVKGSWKDRVEVPGTGSCFFRGATNDGQGVMPRHGGKINVAFVDGHVALVNPSEIDWGSRDTGKSYVGFGHF